MTASDPFNELDQETKASIAGALWQEHFDPARFEPGVRSQLTDAKNSNRAFGERTRARLRYLLDHPDSFTPDYTERYETLISYADTLTPHQAYEVAMLLGLDSSKGFAKIPEAAALSFPAIHEAQLQSQVGWHFFVGSCWGENGKEYGIELMFWQVTLLPPPIARQFGLSDAQNQILELQFAISEAGERHYQAVPIIVAGTTGLLDFQGDPFLVAQGKNEARSLQAGRLFPIRLQAQGTYRGGAVPVELAIDLTLSSERPPLLQGADGCMPCCAGVGTLYYSIPNLVLDPARSTLRLKGEEVKLSSGTFWMDHQWGTGMAPGGSPRSHPMRAMSNLGPAGPGGWDWFMAQFTGNRQITCYRLHSNEYLDFYFQTGPTPPGTMTVPVSAKYMDEHGQQHDAAGSLSIPSWIKSEDTPDPAQYPPTGTWYPNRWEFSFGNEVPEDIRRFTMAPIVDSGQAGYFANGAQYSEGAVRLLDAQEKDVGRGFAESVMYADTKHVMLRLAGLPDTEEMRALFERPKPSLGLKLRSLAYLALPGNRKELKRLMGDCVEHGLDLGPQKLHG